jgi:choline dehydrogenase-like flavoprotein
MLTDERDALNVQRVKLDWRLTAADKRSVRRTMEILVHEVGRLGSGRVRLLVNEDELTWPADMAGGWHLMGTTRMSDDPKQGVVDRVAAFTECRICM